MKTLKKLASRKLGVAIGGTAALTQLPDDLTLPVAILAGAYILGQAIVDAWGNND